MTKNEKVIGGIGAIALILALFGLVGSNQSVSDEQIAQIAGEVVAQSRTLGGGTRFVNGLSTDTTEPSAGEVRTATLTTTGTTTLAESVDGLVVGGTISTAATGTVRTVYTNSTGPKICDASTGYLYLESSGALSPSYVWSLGTSTSAIASTNLIASSTVATGTDTVIAPTASLFVLAQGDVLTAIMGDITNANASTTYNSLWTAEAGVWCQDVSIP